MKITNIVGREIFDSRAMPTIDCQITLEDNSIVNASVPIGTSKSKYEAAELRDGGSRLNGKGVLNAVEIINNIIRPKFIGKEPNVIEMDIELAQMDGTSDKSKFGANTLLAVSMAMYRAHALVSQIELFDFISFVSGAQTISMPIPMINFISGGLHSDNNLLIQEYLVIPYGSNNARIAVENSINLFNSLKEILKLNNKTTATGYQGAFAPNFENDIEPLNYIVDAIENLKLQPDMFGLGIDVAASQFYNDATNLYEFGSQKKSSEQMIEWYKSLLQNHNLFSLEDPLDQDDWQGWIKMMNEVGKKVHIVADDLFATNAERISKGIELGAANTAIIKPNQIGTITETLQAIQLCKEGGLSTIISSRSGETDDTFIVDLAVGTNASYIKCGGLYQGERISKYNRLLEIENSLTDILG